MYEEYFRFSSSPFRLSPDPRFFFGSRSHNKAMAYLHYGLRQGEGFIIITGEIGAGKSMLIGHLIDQLDRSNVVAAQLLTANLEPNALLAHILSAFRIEPAGEGESAAIEAFEDFLFDQMSRGRRVLLIVDEAQNLPKRTIEELRMLSNIDYDGTPLFQVFLVGQPEFKDVMSADDMEQLRQRVIASYHLEPLGRDETRDYIRHRLDVVGWNNDPSMAEDAFDAIFAATGGVPRKINRLCNRIFLSCALEKQHAIDRKTVDYVVADMESDGLEQSDGRKPAAAENAEPPQVEQEKPIETLLIAEESERRAAVNDRDPPAVTPRPPVVVPFAEVRKHRPTAADKNSPSLKSAPEAPIAAPAAEKVAAPEKMTSPATLPESATRSDRASDATGVAAQKNETEPASNNAPLSVFDRLNAARAGGAEKAAVQPIRTGGRAPASLSDVARAIEEAAASSVEAREHWADESDASDASQPAVEEIAPPQQSDPKQWKASVIRTLDDARSELKTAHRSVARLRRRLIDLEKERIERRARIAANLSRAEQLLAEIRDAWR